jgi:organic hydroperoxide reductase OsmC/OhrA
VTWHLVGGLGLAGAIAACFQAQLPAIRGQHALIDDVMDEVRRVRLDRGLDVNG